MTEAKKKIDVGSPWPDSMQSGKRCVGLVGIHVSDGCEVDATFGNRLANLADRLDLCCRQAEPFKLVGASPSDRVVIKGIERRE